MGLKKQFLAGIALGLGIAACAGASFPYKYYGLDLRDSKLLGAQASDDLDLVLTCAATATNASPCTAMLTDEALALKQEYITLNQQLVACQQQLSTK